MNRKILFFILTCLAVQRLAAQETSRSSNPPSRDQIAKWISELANSEPQPSASPYVLNRPRNIDRNALNVVKNAYDNLCLNVVDAIPQLIDGLNDKRYAFYQESSSGAFVFHDVGYACSHIITDNIEIYRPFLTVLDDFERPRTVHFVLEMGGIQKWYSTRGNKTLFEMQLEAVEWALKQSKPNSSISANDWRNAKKELEEFYDAFKAKKKPKISGDQLWFEGK